MSKTDARFTSSPKAETASPAARILRAALCRDHVLIRIPNELTSETLKKSENGERLHSVNSTNELFQELDS